MVKSKNTSKETILSTCRALVSEKGLASVNMRSVAEASQVALGTLYYHFPSKEDLLIAAIHSVWEDIFSPLNKESPPESFLDYINLWYGSVQRGTKEYTQFFNMHSMGFASKGKNKAKAVMDWYFEDVKTSMVEVLEKDPMLSPLVFTSTFTPSAFVDFVLSTLLTYLLQQREDCQILLDIIQRTIYDHQLII